jgi:hypothetical protein
VVKVALADVLAHPCPTCKMPAHAKCCDDDGHRVDGVHNTRIHRYQVVTEAVAHNREIEAMTDIAIPDQQPAPGVDLELWARKAQSAAVYSEAVCSTSMVPAAYRGKPAEATAAILAGAELGFSPMASLRAFDNIQGVPAPKAMTLRAVVQAAGHQVEIVESTAERAVVRGRRGLMSGWQTSVWDIARAQAMPQFKSNPNYKSNPAAMLVARATAEVCRWIAADAIMGMPYAAEEVGDFEPAPAPPPAVRRLSVADLDAPDAIEGPMAAEEKQRRHMFALWNDLGYGGDANREKRLQITAKILGLPELESSSDLTSAEAEAVIDALRERLRQAGGPQQ